MQVINVKKFSQIGFTTIELIVVIIICSILAATAMPKFQGNNVYKNVAAHDVLLAQLRHLQKFAAGSRRLVCIENTSSGLVTVAENYPDTDCNKVLQINLADNENSKKPNSVNFSEATEIPSALYFHSDGTISSSKNSAADNIIFKVQDRKIQIFGNSGYIKGDAQK